MFFIIVIVFTACIKKEKLKNIYFEKDGNIYSYNLNSNKSTLFLNKGNDNLLWSIRFNEKKDKFLIVKDRFFKIKNDDYMEGNIEIYSYPSKKMLKTIGSSESNEKNAVFYGENIVYISNMTGEDAVYICDINTQKEKLISESGKKSIYPVIKGDILLFQTYNFDKNKWEIFSYNLKTGIREKINDFERNFEYPVFYFDGKKIALEETEFDRSYIGIYDLEKREYKRITNNGKERYPVYLPDGKEIVYVSEGNIYIVNIGSLESKKLTNYKYPDIASNPFLFDEKSIVYEEITADKNIIKILNINTMEKIEVGNGNISFVN